MAVRGTGRKLDPGIKNGLQWLLNMIGSQWSELSLRVESSKRCSEEARLKEIAAKKERVQKQLAERFQIIVNILLCY